MAATKLTAAYRSARSAGWLPPLAAPMAVSAALRPTLRASRELDPRAAAAIFAVAWLAGFSGSVAALLIAAALFVGLLAARIVTTGELVAEPIAPPQTAEPFANPLVEALASGLCIKKVEFVQAVPTGQGRGKQSA